MGIGKIVTERVVEVSEWDALVSETYGKPYSFQQQDGCKERQRFNITIPDRDYDYGNDTIPEVVNHDEMGVSFKAWLARDPDQHLPDEKGSWSLALWWERNFYPDVQTIANDLHSKGLIEAGDYVINIDW